ncbi:MAG: six-hairpin glycosidase-like protein, partial [Bacteroidota bacterium]
HQSERGYKGEYAFTAKSGGDPSFQLAPESSYQFPVYLGATLNDESREDFDYEAAKAGREAFLRLCQQNLQLQTPNPVFDLLFYFAKIRASESIFESSMGVVHSPGGGNYYTGIWANDQVEYSGPFFPYLGYPTANEAAFNAYRKFAQNIPQDDSSHIAYAFEVDGNFPMTHLDRGDAAMIAYGTSLYLLNNGNMGQAEELWPLIEWSLAYCERMRNEAGAVASESDEMEGRIETGSANLSTSTLYYGGLKYSIPIAKALKQKALARQYQKQLAEMEEVIDNYFGATIDGLESYRYYDGNTNFRHWICLPLTMGIETRKEGTLDALFDKLWTDNGILVQYDPSLKAEEQIFWDRATLYALRGALKVGENELALQKLQHYSHKRLLGDHVPYPIEAYPENNMKHLSAESALYCRIYLEGLLGIEPISFEEISLRPSLPSGWDQLSLRAVYLLGEAYDLQLQREGEQIRLRLQQGEQTIYDQLISEGSTVSIKL